MNKSFYKFVTDFGPLLVFFTFYYKNEKNLEIAIPPFILATLIALFIVWKIEKKIPLVPLLGGILITLFGGLTIYFKNPIFIYIKPTIINILFALGLLFGKFFTQEPVLKKLLGNALKIQDEGWQILNKRWEQLLICNKKNLDKKSQGSRAVKGGRFKLYCVSFVGSNPTLGKCLSSSVGRAYGF